MTQTMAAFGWGVMPTWALAEDRWYRRAALGASRLSSAPRFADVELFTPWLAIIPKARRGL